MLFLLRYTGLLVGCLLSLGITKGRSQQFNQAISVKFVDEQSLMGEQELKRVARRSNSQSTVSNKGEISIKWERVFPQAGKHEEKHRAHGLHLWYRMVFDSTSINTQEVIRSLEEDSRVELTEIYKAKLSTLPQDSLFHKQWNFYNTGQMGGLVGHDIDFINSSKLESGDPRVVVSIHDTGIDMYNPELTANLWVNEDEIPDNGIDDDDNGYIDDVHGYGFGEMNTKLNDTHGHGSHISGVVAAKWNSKGVVGLAGGKTLNDGIRLMVCRLDWDQEGLSIIRPEESLVYAADNGSIISQNSWNTFGFSYTVKAAVEYFTSNAKNEMLNGGVVVFAAGNNGSSIPRYEGENPRVMMVANIDRNSALNAWSNFGSWIDVSAPGTDIFSNGVFGGYMNMSGTSMAAPHVSGVAALVVSKYGHPQLTPEEVISKVKSSAVNIDKFNPHRLGMTGSGRVNAFRALLDLDTLPPQPVTHIQIAARAYDATLSWTTPLDNTIAPFYYVISLRKNAPVTETSFEDYIIDTFHIANPEHLAQITYQMDELAPNTNYHVSVQALDYFKKASSISESEPFLTQSNPTLELKNHKIVHNFHVDSSYQTSWIIENLGASELDWSLTKTLGNDSLKLRDLRVGIFTVYYQYTDTKEFIEAHGGTVTRLPYDFYESDLKGIQLILLEAGVHLMDTTKATILSNWVKRGGNLILAANGIYAIPFLNAFGREFGVTYKPYETYRQEKIEDFAQNPFTENVYTLELLYYDLYLEFNHQNFDPIVYDKLGNLTAAVTNYHKGKVLLASNNFWGTFFTLYSNNRQFAINAINWFSDYTDIRFSKQNGVVAPQSSDTISVHFNQNLSNGFNGHVYLKTNDSTNLQTKLDYVLDIEGYALARQSKYAIDFDTLFVNFNADSSFKIYSKGLDSLFLHQAKSNTDSVFLYSESNITLASGDSIEVNVRFQPETDGLFIDTLLFVGNVKDTLQLIIKGFAQWPAILKVFPEDSIIIDPYEAVSQTKTIYVLNEGIGVNLKGSITLRPMKPQKPTQQDAKATFMGKRIGVTNLSVYFNAFHYLNLTGNNVFDFKTNLNNNPFPLDSIDLIILDYRIFSISNGDLDKIVAWVKRGGSLIYQGDQNDNPSKLNKLFSQTSVKQIEYYGQHLTDTLRSLTLHPITENLDFIFVNQHYSYLKTTDPSKVIVRDVRNNPYAVYDYIENGKVMFVADDFFSIPSIKTDTRFLVQSLNWLINPEKPYWVSFTPSEIDLQSEENLAREISFINDSSANHLARVEIRSNDPYIPVKNIIINYSSENFPSLINRAPSVSQLSNKSVEENSPNLMVLDTLKAFDKDGDKLYFFTHDQHRGIDIESEVGIIFVSDSSQFDFELQSEISSTLYVTDKTDTVVVPYPVLVTNVNERPYLVSNKIEMNEDDSVTLSLQVIDPENDEVTIDIQPRDSLFFNAGTWQWSDDSSTLSLKPPKNANGSSTFNVKLNDGHYTIESLLELSVNARNDSPWLMSVEAQTLILDSLQSFYIRVGDIDNDTLQVMFDFDHPELFEAMGPIQVIKNIDTLNVTYNIRALGKGKTNVNIKVYDRLDSAYLSYPVEIKSLEEVMGVGKDLFGISIYPNPSSGWINIDSKTEPIKSIQIIDLLGGTQAQFNIPSGLHKQSIATHTLARGVYILQVETRSGSAKIRIVLE